MNEEIRTLLKYRLERASEAIEEAKILFDKGHGNTFGMMKQKGLLRK